MLTSKTQSRRFEHAAARSGGDRRRRHEERLYKVRQRGDIDEEVQVARGAALAGRVRADQAPRRVAVHDVCGSSSSRQQQRPCKHEKEVMGWAHRLCGTGPRSAATA